MGRKFTTASFCTNQDCEKPHEEYHERWNYCPLCGDELTTKKVQL